MLSLRHADALPPVLQRIPLQSSCRHIVLAVQEAVATLIRAGMRNPYHVNVTVTTDGGQPAQKTPTTLDARYLVVPGDHKVAQLLAFLQQHSDNKVICYALTCAIVEWLALALPQMPGGNAMPALALHGNMKQAKVSRLSTTCRKSHYPQFCLIA